MVGAKRLASLQECCWTALQANIEGDFVETGVWRGGCGILMRAVLEAAGDESRKVWLFDSFEGIPRADVENYPVDEPDRLWTFNSFLGVSEKEVRANFAKFDLLDERTKFVAGWFRDTIPGAPVEKISVLRLDGDIYESTWLVLTHLYPKVSPGGFVIIDDYAVPSCRPAVDDFRAKFSISAPITQIDWSGIFWRK